MPKPCAASRRLWTSASLSLLERALPIPDPNMQVMGWEIKTRAARADQDTGSARRFIERALALVSQFDIPVVGWRVHSSACDVCSDEGNYAGAEEHRARARELILRIADSFDPEEPLRQSFLAAPPVRRIFVQGACV